MIVPGGYARIPSITKRRRQRVAVRFLLAQEVLEQVVVFQHDGAGHVGALRKAFARPSLWILLQQQARRVAIKESVAFS